MAAVMTCRTDAVSRVGDSEHVGVLISVGALAVGVRVGGHREMSSHLYSFVQRLHSIGTGCYCGYLTLSQTVRGS